MMLLLWCESIFNLRPRERTVTLLFGLYFICDSMDGTTYLLCRRSLRRNLDVFSQYIASHQMRTIHNYSNVKTN